MRVNQVKKQKNIHTVPDVAFDRTQKTRNSRKTVAGSFYLSVSENSNGFISQLNGFNATPNFIGSKSHLRSGSTFS